jgi:hypothetical protein
MIEINLRASFAGAASGRPCQGRESILARCGEARRVAFAPMIPEVALPSLAMKHGPPGRLCCRAYGKGVQRERGDPLARLRCCGGRRVARPERGSWFPFPAASREWPGAVGIARARASGTARLPRWLPETAGCGSGIPRVRGSLPRRSCVPLPTIISLNDIVWKQARCVEHKEARGFVLAAFRISAGANSCGRLSVS